MQRTRLVKKQKPSALPHDSDDERFRSRIKTCTVGKSVSSESLSLNLKLLRQRELCPSIHLERTVSHQLSRLEVGSQWQLNSLVSCVDIDEAESRLLLFGCASGNVNVMNLDNSSISNIVTTSKMVSHCLFQPSASHTFLSVGTDNRVAVWDIVKATSSNSFSSDSRILNVGWNSSGEVFPAIAAANFTPHVPIYDVRVGDTGRFVSVPWKATSVCWLPTDGSWMLMIGGANGDIGLWDVRSARKQLAVLCGSRGTYKSAHACPVGAMKAVGNRLVTYSTDNRLQVFDATSLALESVLRTWSTTYKAIPNDPSTPFAATCISNELIVALPSSTDVHLTNLSKAGEATSVSLAGHVQAVRACVFRPHHYELFSAGGDKRLIKWSSSLCRPHSDEKSLRKRAEAMRDNWSDSE